MHALEWAFVVKIRKLGGGFIEDRMGKLSGFQSLKWQGLLSLFAVTSCPPWGIVLAAASRLHSPNKTLSSLYLGLQLFRRGVSLKWP